jgi:hypothetical protein
MELRGRGVNITGGTNLGKVDEYRRRAAETIELADKATTTVDKGRLLTLAGKWLDLADRTHRRAKQHSRRIGEYPLVIRTLGRRR